MLQLDDALRASIGEERTHRLKLADEQRGYVDNENRLLRAALEKLETRLEDHATRIVDSIQRELADHDKRLIDIECEQFNSRISHLNDLFVQVGQTIATLSSGLAGLRAEHNVLSGHLEMQEKRTEGQFTSVEIILTALRNQGNGDREELGLLRKRVNQIDGQDKVDADDANVQDMRREKAMRES